ncbi:MFS transporter [Halalkalibacter okhensis]|uniref:Arabinose ABC transporter permease n=1 Tax=Halalkalibacter okhensis TaxID=333138 RepID=A0A0B0IJG6_9BACI|nr:MFS transporter [Halalkalibacter okhensis]KHF41425.1 arabinose ABC transporter permease [Halalkalibacter okhensis]
MKFYSFDRTIQIRLWLMFISTTSTMAVLPYLIIYFSKQVGSLMTGILFLIVMIFNVLGSVLGGYVSDKTGRKKLILISELIIFVGYIGVAFANSNWGVFPYVTFLFFILIQFSHGVGNPVYQALIIDMSTPEERKSIYTFSYWFRNIGIAIGSMIGAFLFFDYLFYLFLGVAVTTLFTFLMTYLFIKETYVPVQQSNNQKGKESFQMLRSYTKIMSHRFFVIFSVASLLFISVEEQLTNYIGVRLANEITDSIPFVSFLPFEVDGVNLLGILKSENTILVVCFTMILTGLINKRNDQHVLVIGLFFFFAGYTIISISQTPMILVLAMFFASIGEIMYIPVSQAMLSNMVPDHARSTYMAFYSVAAIMGVSSAGIFMIMSSWLSPITLTTIIGIMGVVSITLYFNLSKKLCDKKDDGKNEERIKLTK